MKRCSGKRCSGRRCSGKRCRGQGVMGRGAVGRGAVGKGPKGRGAMEREQVLLAHTPSTLCFPSMLHYMITKDAPFLYGPSPPTPLTVVLSRFTSCPQRLQHKVTPCFYMQKERDRLMVIKVFTLSNLSPLELKFQVEYQTPLGIPISIWI